MTYNWKLLQEVAWAVAVAVLLPLLITLTTFDPDKITDWHVWAVSILASMVRAGAAAIVAALSKDGGFKKS